MKQNLTLIVILVIGLVLVGLYVNNQFNISNSKESEIVLREGQREGPLLVEKIYPDRITGLNFIEYPISNDRGSPVTLRIGESVSNGCDVQLTLIRISSDTAVFLKKTEPNKPCPICLSEETLIDTPNGLVNVKDLKEGMQIWTADTAGFKKVAVILKTSSVKVLPDHQMLHLVLEDKRELYISPQHPMADGRAVYSIIPNEIIDGSRVVLSELVPYQGTATYDVLPSGETGIYWANGIPVKSTLYLLK